LEEPSGPQGQKPSQEDKEHLRAKPGRADKRSGTSCYTSPSSTCLLSSPLFRILYSCRTASKLPVLPPSAPPPSATILNNLDAHTYAAPACTHALLAFNYKIAQHCLHSTTCSIDAPNACSTYELKSNQISSGRRWAEEILQDKIDVLKTRLSEHQTLVTTKSPLSPRNQC